MKPVTPYARLLRKYGHAITRATCPHRVTMWQYPKADLARPGGWRLDDLAERVQAADQLGYDVRLYCTDVGLYVQYVKRFVEPAE